MSIRSNRTIRKLIADPVPSSPGSPDKSRRRPIWPDSGYNIADEITDPTDWSINADASLAIQIDGGRRTAKR